MRAPRAEGLTGGSEKTLPVSEEERRRKLWYLAVKPPMYSVGIIPVLVSDLSILFSF